MFGYVRPLKGELKVREFERFKSVYCGLCHEIGRKYGKIYSGILNYDLAFLALTIDAFSQEDRCEYKKCISSGPFRKKCVRCGSRGIALSADISVILTYNKLLDTAADEGFFRAAASRLLAFFMKRAYNKASAMMPDFRRHTEKCLAELSEIEKSGGVSIDRPADCFASIMSEAMRQALFDFPELARMFYHIGRWIYLVDAYDDLPEDIKKKRYNPLIGRFSLKTPELSDTDMESFRFTLYHSLAAASELLDKLHIGQDRTILENVVCLGLFKVTEDVLNRAWKRDDRL